jgi:hypothetical protein
MRTWLIVGGAVVVVIALGAILYLNVRGPGQIRGVVTFARPSRGHDNAIEYQTAGLPPAGGVHFDQWQNCGIYEEPIDIGNAIHSLEHGAVWVTYRSDLPAAEVEQLQQMVRGQSYALLSPFPELKSPVVLTAWGLQLEVDSVDDRRIEQFIDRYQQGPQTPERGATCRDGVGTPLP